MDLPETRRRYLGTREKSRSTIDTQKTFGDKEENRSTRDTEKTFGDERGSMRLDKESG